MTTSNDFFDSLIAAASSGNVAHLDSLLLQPAGRKTALSKSTVHHNLTTITVPTTRLMLEASCKNGKSKAAQRILGYATEQGIAIIDLLTRDTCLAAIDGPAARDLFEIFLPFMPEIVNQDFGHLVDPLSYAIHKENLDLILFLLRNGADPNAGGGAHAGPGHHLQLAAKKFSPEIASILLQNGAKVGETGATHKAAEVGDVELLNVLVNHGADVNETLDSRLGFLGRPGSDAAWNRASETPLDVAINHGHGDAANWLREHGARVSNDGS